MNVVRHRSVGGMTMPTNKWQPLPWPRALAFWAITTLLGWAAVAGVLWLGGAFSHTSR